MRQQVQIGPSLRKTGWRRADVGLLRWVAVALRELARELENLASKKR